MKKTINFSIALSAIIILLTSCEHCYDCDLASGIETDREYSSFCYKGISAKKNSKEMLDSLKEVGYTCIKQ